MLGPSLTSLTTEIEFGLFYDLSVSSSIINIHSNLHKNFTKIIPILTLGRRATGYKNAK